MHKKQIPPHAPSGIFLGLSHMNPLRLSLRKQRSEDPPSTPHSAEVEIKVQRRDGTSPMINRVISDSGAMPRTVSPVHCSFQGEAHNTAAAPEDGKPSISMSPVCHFLHKKCHCWNEFMMVSIPISTSCEQDICCIARVCPGLPGPAALTHT